MARRSLRLGALALLPMLLFASVGHGYAVYRCRVDLVARASCCCPTNGEEQRQNRDATVAQACCCDREVVSFTRPASHTEHRPLDAPVGHVVVPTWTPPPPSVVSRVRARVAWFAVGPPIVLLKSSFLI